LVERRLQSLDTVRQRTEMRVGLVTRVGPAAGSTQVVAELLAGAIVRADIALHLVVGRWWLLVCWMLVVVLAIVVQVGVVVVIVTHCEFSVGGGGGRGSDARRR